MKVYDTKQRLLRFPNFSAWCKLITKDCTKKNMPSRSTRYRTTGSNCNPPIQSNNTDIYIYIHTQKRGRKLANWLTMVGNSKRHQTQVENRPAGDENSPTKNQLRESTVGGLLQHTFDAFGQSGQYRLEKTQVAPANAPHSDQPL